MMFNNLSKEQFLKYLNWLFIILIVVGVCYRFVIFFVARSTSLDEAMLAKCLVVRDIFGLCQGHLEYGQSAPLGYLLSTKLFVMLFGVNEYSLRLYSLLAGLGTLWMGYLISVSILKMKMPLMVVAALACVPVLCSYSNELKPYMGDVFFTLTSIWLYHKYKQDELSLWIVALLYSLFVWLSFGCLFVMGGICIYHVFVVFHAGFKTNERWGKVLAALYPILLIGISVLVYYFLWVKPSTENITEGANEYWRFLSFPIIPTSLADFKLIFLMAKDFLSPIKSLIKLLYLAFFLFSVWHLRKEWYTKSLVITVLMVLSASSLGLFPISLRLQLFLFATFMIYVVYGMYCFVINIAFNRITAFLSVFVIAFPMLLPALLMVKDSPLYRDTGEFKSCFNYAKGELSNNDGIIYFPGITRPSAEFYTGYKQDMALGFKEPIQEESEYIWGSLYRIMKNSVAFQYDYVYDESEIAKNVDFILKHDKVYIINCHNEADSIEQLLGALEKYGKVSIAYEFHKSYVYLFERM